mgnify:CR=1 FL=1
MLLNHGKVSGFRLLKKALKLGPVLFVIAFVSLSFASTAATLDLSGTAVVVNQKSDSVSLIDLSKLEAYAHIPVVGGPHEAAVAPDGKRVVVSNYFQQGGRRQNTLSVIALPEGQVLKTISLGDFWMPHDVQWVNNSQVVTTSEANKALLLVNIDSGKIERVFKTGSRGSHMLALSPDRKRLYCSNMTSTGSVTVFDFMSGRKIRDISTGSESEGIGVSLDGRWLWVGNRAEDTLSIIDTKSFEVVKTLNSPGFPYRVKFTPDGKSVLIPHARSSALIIGDVETKAIVKRIPVTKTQVKRASIAGVFPLPDNEHALVTVRNDNALLVVNLLTGKTLKRIPVQSSPDGVAYSPVSRR